MHRLCSNPAVGTAYDGNGNVSALVDSADGSLDAKYEYGAFGEPLRVGGTSIADDNPFRFSTKYLDSDEARKRVDGDAKGVARRAEEAGALWAMMRQSGLIYYGFRYYSASLGRFLNRDPIGEAGGTNLYAFIENNPVNGWDYLGYGPDYIGGQSCESQCRSYMGEHRYRSFEECMEDLCTGELEPYIVEEVQVPEPYMGLGYLIGEDEDGGGGDGGGASWNDGCDEEKEDDDRPFWCAAIEGALAANESIGDVNSWLLELLGIDSKFTFGGSGGGTFAFPLTSNLLGVGGHGEAGGNFSIDFADPLNTRVYAFASASLMATQGGGAFLNAGLIYGISERHIEPGYSTQEFIHIEGSFSYVGGGAVQADILTDKDYDIFRDPFDFDGIFEGINVSVYPRAAFGGGAFVGVGGGKSWNISTPPPKRVLQDLYEKECK